MKDKQTKFLRYNKEIIPELCNDIEELLCNVRAFPKLERTQVAYQKFTNKPLGKTWGYQESPLTVFVRYNHNLVFEVNQYIGTAKKYTITFRVIYLDNKNCLKYHIPFNKISLESDIEKELVMRMNLAVQMSEPNDKLTNEERNNNVRDFFQKYEDIFIKIRWNPKHNDKSKKTNSPTKR